RYVRRTKLQTKPWRGGVFSGTWFKSKRRSGRENPNATRDSPGTLLIGSPGESPFLITSAVGRPHFDLRTGGGAGTEYVQAQPRCILWRQFIDIAAVVDQ